MGVGEADGDDEGLVVADGELEGDCDGLALWLGAELPCAGPTRFGGCTGCLLGVSRSTSVATTTPATTMAPLVAAPAANARRSRRASVRRRSRSQSGSAARCAAQLLTGAAAKPRVGNSSRPASSGPLSWYHLDSAAAMPPAEQRQGYLGPVRPQRLPPLRLLAGFRSAQEGRLAGEQAQHRGPRHHQRGGLPDEERAERVAPRRAGAPAQQRHRPDQAEQRRAPERWRPGTRSACGTTHRRRGPGWPRRPAGR